MQCGTICDSSISLTERIIKCFDRKTTMSCPLLWKQKIKPGIPGSKPSSSLACLVSKSPSALPKSISEWFHFQSLSDCLSVLSNAEKNQLSNCWRRNYYDWLDTIHRLLYTSWYLLPYYFSCVGVCNVTMFSTLLLDVVVFSHQIVPISE